MAEFSWNLNWFLLLLFISLEVSSSAADPSPPPPVPDACTSRDCGQGTCKVSSTSLIGFECDCYPGWSKFLTSPYCIIPNCTLNLSCGAPTETPPAPPPPPPPPPPFLSLPPLGCFLVFCLDGECVADGTSHVCQCNSGSDNLLDTPSLPCLKKCSLGLDCNNVTLGPPLTPPPPSTSSAPPSIGAVSPALAPNGSRSFRSLSALLLASSITLLVGI